MLEETFKRPCQRIKFQGDDLLLVNGTICTEEQFKNGHSGYAVLEDGVVMRHGEAIGTIDDIEFLGLTEIELSLEDIIVMAVNMIEGTWYEPNA